LRLLLRLLLLLLLLLLLWQAWDVLILRSLPRVPHLTLASHEVLDSLGGLNAAAIDPQDEAACDKERNQRKASSHALRKGPAK